jgi:hypothetical protein
MKQHTKTLFCLILILTLTIPLAFAVNTINPQPPPQTTSLEDIKQTIIQQGIQTRTEITAYSDRKITEMITTVRTDGQKFIDDNYKVLDARIQEIALKLLIKLVLGIFFAIILSSAVWYAIRRAIEKKERLRPKDMTQDQYLAKKHGLISEEKKTQLLEEDHTIIKQTPLSETRLEPPTPPSISEIEKIIAKNRLENNKQKIEGITQEEARLTRKEVKLAEKIAKKSKNRFLKNTKNLEKKLQRLEDEKRRLNTLKKTIPNPDDIEIDSSNLKE